MSHLRALSLTCLLILLTGCAGLQPNDDNAYSRAIADAAVIEANEIVLLPVIDAAHISVVTWTNYPDSYKPGQYTELTWGETWVTLNGTVQQRCQQMPPANLITGLQKLLGLPLAPDQGRSFVTLEVERADLFRPCADPSLSKPHCGATFPESASEQHRAWYAGQTANAYQSPNGYPWTRLGYTYNWQEGESEVGPAEFVIRKGARVKTLAINDNHSFCAP